jgi:LysR family transcriptional regulator, glycine cleavage system transcriptional activator
MGRDLPPWAALEAFIAAARSLSFREAAEELGLSAPAFTRRIQALEQHIGVRLFDRDARRASLTPAGRHYFHLVQPGFESLRIAAALMAPDARLRPLRMRISHSLATIWLAPRLAQFCAEHPQIDLQLQSAGTPDDLEAGLIDVGIFHSRTPLEGLAAERLFALEAFVVAAPSLAGIPLANLEDIVAHPLLDLTDPGEIWPEWLRAAGYAGPQPHKKFLFDSIEVMYQAAAAGVGLALGMRPIVDPFLATGRLRIALVPGHVMAGAYYVAATKRTLRHAAARKLWRWIAAQGAATANAELPPADPPQRIGRVKGRVLDKPPSTAKAWPLT